MRQQSSLDNRGFAVGASVTDLSGNFQHAISRLPRLAVIGVLLVVALIAFEIFNFDTTRYALSDLLGEVSFMGIRWATILAVAFCAIDFAGLAYLLGPDRGHNETWYLMGAWLLGATMNALMTWWAVSLTLLSHEFGNEVLGRQELLDVVPIFVAVLVWLTRILFIGAFSVTGSRLFSLSETESIPAAARQEASLRSDRPDSVPQEPAIAYKGSIDQSGGRSTPTRIHRRPPNPGVSRPSPIAAQPARRR